MRYYFFFLKTPVDAKMPHVQNNNNAVRKEAVVLCYRPTLYEFYEGELSFFALLVNLLENLISVTDYLAMIEAIHGMEKLYGTLCWTQQEWIQS